MPYAYNAEMYCDDCGDQIKAELDARGVEGTGDTDDYPQWSSGDDPSDSPDHCANRGACLNVIKLGVHSYGALVTEALTPDGEEYVRREVWESGPGSVAREIWAEAFNVDLPYTGRVVVEVDDLMSGCDNRAEQVQRVAEALSDLAEWLEEDDYLPAEKILLDINGSRLGVIRHEPEDE